MLPFPLLQCKFKKEGLTWACSLDVQATVLGGSAVDAVDKGAGYIASTVQKQRDMSAEAALTSSCCFRPGSQSVGWRCPPSGGVFLLQSSFSSKSLTDTPRGFVS